MGVASPIKDLHRGGDYTSAHMQCQFRDSHQNEFLKIAQLLVTSNLIHRCQNGASAHMRARLAVRCAAQIDVRRARISSREKTSLHSAAQSGKLERA
jgi:cytidylate kinase